VIPGLYLGGCVLETHQITQNLGPDETPGPEEKLKPGTVLENRYQIEYLHGAGGMSTVYRARDLRFSVEKPVAVKEMINHAHDDFMREAAVAIFKREANILASLDHPAIPKIYDYFTIGVQSYLVMEFIQGFNLETIINQSKGFLAESQVIKWTIDLCDVLDYLHNHEPQPIIFRDIKPTNIVITPDNRVVLVDFGIAKAFQVGQKGTMIGTEGYSPPEQYRGEATPAVDIYALGATLHHIFTRIDPRTETPFTFSERPIREINPNISIELESFVNTALQYNASDRFKDAITMKEALISIARKTGGISMYGETETIVANQSIKPLWTFDCEDEIRGTATYDDGVIYVGSYDNNLYALDYATGKFIWKYPTDGGIVSRPAVFENNIYFGSEDERLHVVSPHSGRIVWTYYTDGPIRSSPHIADRHVFIGSDDSHIHVVNAATGRRALKVDLGAPVRSTPLVSGENVYLGVENGEFFCLDFRGRIRWRVRAKRAITSSPTCANEMVFFGSVDGLLYAVDAKTGWGIWRFRMERGTISSPQVADNLIFIGSADGNIYCVDIRSSKEVWRFGTDHQVSSSPIAYKDSVYCGGVDGYIYCIELKTGQLRWKFKTDGAITGSPIIHDDIVYIGSTDHRMYALPT
jgi:outer membrane protein assembly factor BamB/tRNA A-37 threonylcarbamoyl transferase component Bud32